MLPSPGVLDTLQSELTRDLTAFAPELALAGAIVAMLVARLFKSLERQHAVTFAVFAVFAALLYSAMQWYNVGTGVAPRFTFTTLLNLDPWAIAFRLVILISTLGVLLLSRASGLPDRTDSADYAVLVLGSTLGLMLMASANHLLMLFLALEMASLPGYALAGFLKGRGTGSEAALKYVIFGAAASGALLYGISLLVARTGSGSYAALGLLFANIPADFHLAAALVLIGIGLAYKLSIVPMHVWLPDVFEGAPAEIAAFLSVASKAATVALLGRLLHVAVRNAPDAVALTDNLGLTLAILGAITATYGNLLAYAQTNLNRLLGYSTIAHAGLLLAGLATLSMAGRTASLVYIAAYIAANLAAFAVVIAVRRRTGREDIGAVAGLVTQSPVLGVGFAVALASLLGLPPLGGFVGKFLVFEALFDVSRASSSGGMWWGVFAVLLVNTALGAGYYLKLIRLAGFDEADAPPRGEEGPGLRVLIVGLTIASVALGLGWGPLTRLATMAATG